MRSKIVLLAGVLILVLVNWSILGKEQHLAEGRVVYLELAPVDPRSLMQGDYMRLRFKLADEIRRQLPKKSHPQRWRHELDAADGRVVVELDDHAVGHFKRLENRQPLADNEVLMRYRVRNGQLKFASNAFFFQEGQASTYSSARYGKFRVDERGELLLTSLHDEQLNMLQPPANQK
ncbi:MAG: GDYXXLXY domain-containing protein [Thioalkalispiraceae bacterium]|jgi:uncharacterized membrane-anchored protein